MNLSPTTYCYLAKVYPKLHPPVLEPLAICLTNILTYHLAMWPLLPAVCIYFKLYLYSCAFIWKNSLDAALNQWLSRQLSHRLISYHCTTCSTEWGEINIWSEVYELADEFAVAFPVSMRGQQLKTANGFQPLLFWRQGSQDPSGKQASYLLCEQLTESGFINNQVSHHSWLGFWTTRL